MRCFTEVPSSDQAIALVELSLQHCLKLIRQIETVSKAPNLIVSRAIYNIRTGLLFLLEGSEPPRFRANLDDIIPVGTLDTADVSKTPQTKCSKQVTFATPYSKPPKIFLGLTSVDVKVDHDNLRMLAHADNIKGIFN